MPTKEARSANLASVQPEISPGQLSNTDTALMLEGAFAMAEEAAAAGADLILLPELVNVFGMEPADAKLAAKEADRLIERMSKLARSFEVNAVLPLLERRGDALFNSCKVIDRAGEVIGCYDKVHLTDFEKNGYRLVPGSDYPTFDLDFGRVGIFVCYDLYFPEVARIYACKGADVLCFPSWQSGPSEISIEIQTRARAIDNFVFLVRSSFGYSRRVAWRPGMLFGRSCIIDRAGTLLADAGHHSGVVQVTADLGLPVLMDVLDDGGDVRDLQETVFRHRRPDTYGPLLEETKRQNEF